MITEVN